MLELTKSPAERARSEIERAERRIAHFETLLTSQQNAREEKYDKRDAILADMPAGDMKVLAQIRDGIHEVDLKIAETQAGLDTAKADLGKAQERFTQADLAERRKKAKDALDKRATLARGALLDHVRGLGAVFAQMESLRSKAIDTHPEGRQRARQLFEEMWKEDVALRAAIDRELIYITNGALGDGHSLGHYQTVEAKKALPDIIATVEVAHRRFLGGDADTEPKKAA